ncbi:MAG: nucleotidyltransferase domain-containing protein [Candidatus Diapherotrites archaeon]|nr:nucleotidyltransferase domain-containing protein [Candidatus Diapherotrites archaeon]
MAELSKLRKIFSFLKEDNNVLAVLLFGSRAKRKCAKRSDYDICVVAPKADKAELLRKLFQNIDIKSNDIDLYLFEELPLYLKKEVIESHRILFASDKYELYEYFYLYRKLWADQRHRNELQKEELSAML